MKKLCPNRGAWRPRLMAFALASATLAMPATASVVMNGTRFVYRANEKEITVKVSNVGKLPALTQAWIDSGDPTATPETVDVPFNLTPPIARLEAGKSQTLRVAYTGEALPTDRESQFWINVLEVPPKPEHAEEDGGQVQLAFRYRLKLFYRPKGLPGTAEAAAAGLSWRRTAGGIAVSNDSAFHVTVNELTLTAGGAHVDAEPFAIAPHAAHVLPLAAHDVARKGIDVAFSTINDYGGFVTHKAALPAIEGP